MPTATPLLAPAALLAGALLALPAHAQDAPTQPTPTTAHMEQSFSPDWGPHVGSELDLRPVAADLNFAPHTARRRLPTTSPGDPTIR